MARLSVRGLTGGAGGRVLVGIDLEVEAGERIVVTNRHASVEGRDV